MNIKITPTLANLAFTLEEVQGRARQLAYEAEPVVAYRVLREVLRLPPGEPELVQAKQAAMRSKWVHQLEESQLPDGSWGRFHTQDTKVKTVFRTTEEAIDRAFALGIEPGEGVLYRVTQYIESVLTDKAQITDRVEHNDAFPVLIRYIVAGRLAQIDPTNPLLDPYWAYLLKIAQQAFSSGSYRLEDEANAYLELSGIHAPRSFLQSQHALWILSSRKLSPEVEHSLVSWIWHKPDGIGYLGAALVDPNLRQFWYWLRSMNLLSRFAGWQEAACGTLSWLWNQRNGNGMWDFRSKPSKSVDFPLSDSWRSPAARENDYSTCILALLRKVFD